jgi:hypothetical protein
MRLLLDEAVPATLKRHLSGHEVRTVVEMGWSGVKNGKLLALAAEHFDALVTVDKNMPFQQNPSTLPLPVMVLDSFSNELRFLLPLLGDLQAALQSPPDRRFVIIRGP